MVSLRQVLDTSIDPTWLSRGWLPTRKGPNLFGSFSSGRSRKGWIQAKTTPVWFQKAPISALATFSGKQIMDPTKILKAERSSTECWKQMPNVVRTTREAPKERQNMYYHAPPHA